jgi:hypothetical protein
MAKFSGVWGTFAYLDDAAAAVKALRAQGKDYSVLTPCPRHEIVEAMGHPQSKLPFVVLFCGAAGIFFGYGFPSWSALDWVLPVSAKPIVGIPSFTIIGFELMVLLSGIGAALTILGMGQFDLLRKRLPGSAKFKSYNRFSVDRFGVVVRCPPAEAEGVEALLRQHHAEEVVRES